MVPPAAVVAATMFRVRFYSSSLQRRMARLRSSASKSNLRRCKEEWFRLQRLSRLRCSASDSNLRRCKEEWLACSGSRDDDPPRPILIFVAARKNGSAGSGCRDNDLPRPILIFVAAEKNGPPTVHPQRQPKSRLRLVRCCSDSGFHGVNLGITAGFCLFTPSFVQ